VYKAWLGRDDVWMVDVDLSSGLGIGFHRRRSAAEDEEPEPAEVVPASSGAIHIELPGEVRISLESSVDPAVVRTVLKSLRS